MRPAAGLLLLLAACSEPAPPPPPKPRATPAAPAPKAPSPEPPAIAPEPVAPVPQPPPPPPPPAPPPARPRDFGPAADTQSPAFHLRTIHGGSPRLFVNGQEQGRLPAQWWVSAATEFDPAIPVAEWPPEGAVFRGKAAWTDDDGSRSSSLELWIAGGRYTDLAALRKRHPHLDPADQVFFAKGQIQGRRYQGAVRIQVRDLDTIYRFTTYDPSSGEEDPQAARLKRTIWFEVD